ncbi:MAG: ribbon-helix-helix protein, CopG family [Nitrospirota bacterium]
MSTKVITTIHIKPEQKKKIKTIAKEEGLSFSDTIRCAIDDFLLLKEEKIVNPDELAVLAKEASEAIDRITVKIDKMHETVNAAFKKMEKVK